MPAATSSSSSRSPLLRKRKGDVNSEGSNEQNTGGEYTDEQLAAVEQVRKCKDYYEILGVDKEAGESDLRKQYRKLALQFHPDKNKTPGSAEAFKAIGNAFSVLSDPVKRKQYDTYGLEAMQPTQSYPAQEGFSHTFEGDITPEELFNIFFGGGNTYVRRGNQWQRYSTRATHVPREQEERSVLMQILPLLFIVSVSFLSSFFVSDPPYSLHRTTKFVYEQKTHNLEVTYYVKENFMNDYKGRISYIEKQVEEEYLINLRSSCFRERNYKENMIWRAKHFRDLALEEKARTLRTPSCDVLNDLYTVMHEA